MLTDLKDFRYLHTLRDRPPNAIHFHDEDPKLDDPLDTMESLQLVQIGTLQKRRGGEVEPREDDSQPWYEWTDAL